MVPQTLNCSKNINRCGVNNYRLTSSRVVSTLNPAYKPPFVFNPPPHRGKLVITHVIFTPTHLLDPDNFIVRDSDEFIILEDGGVLELTVRFNISDRKSVGIRNKNRQTSAQYKVSARGLREAITDTLQGVTSGSLGTFKPAGDLSDYVVNNLTQTLEVLINDERIEVVIEAPDLNKCVVNREVDSDAYFKMVLYKAIDTYRSLIAKKTSLTPSEKYLTTSSNFSYEDVLPGSSTPSFGLLVKSVKDPFSTDLERKDKKVAIGSGSLPDDRGRAFSIPTAVSSVSPTGKTSPSKPTFAPFSSLPQVYNVLFTPVGVVYNKGVPSVFSTVKNFLVSQDQYNSLVRDSAIFSPAELIKTLVDNSISARTNYKVQDLLDNQLQLTVTIESRKTTYEIIPKSQLQTPPKQLFTQTADYQGPIIFSRYEDGVISDRAFVRISYLGAYFDKVFLQFARQVHSPRIIYKNIRFDSYEEKEWDESGVTVKKPLKLIESREAAFNLLTTGEGKRDIINQSANLMFTVDFKKNASTFYKTNRFLTCSCFNSQKDLVDPSYAGLWVSIEKAYGEPMVLSEVPLVKLEPCFERGDIIQTSDTLYFAGLVSNASGGVGDTP